MNFFRNLFSSKKKSEADETMKGESDFKGIYTKEHFDSRYLEDKIDSELLEDYSLKMIEGYCIANKIERKIKTPFNHPSNLDQLDQEGFGFTLYCKTLQIEEEQATLLLAFCFSDYLITQYGFKLYKDTQPEYPLREMTLKYDKDRIVLSLYPFEYASKVLNGNETFSGLEEKINMQISKMPSVKEVIQRFISPEDESGG